MWTSCIKPTILKRPTLQNTASIARLKVRVDALHLAIAATNSIQYLLTWNCKHLANATLRATINQVCPDWGTPRRSFARHPIWKRCSHEQLEVDEVHKIREQLLAEYGGDIRALVKDAQRRTEEARLAGREVRALPPRRPESGLTRRRKLVDRARK